MLIVDNCIISEDLADQTFCCDLCKCKGMCCIEGDAGAPLEKDEIDILNDIYPKVQPYMQVAGINEVNKNGVATFDKDSEAYTALVGNRDCVFVVWEDGLAKCAIEKAFLDGKIDFRKPISCHLYPLRIDDYGEYKTINYHVWDICSSAVCYGEKIGVPLYKYLKEPLIRKFGVEWYNELVFRCEEFLENQK